MRRALPVLFALTAAPACRRPVPVARTDAAVARTDAVTPDAAEPSPFDAAIAARIEDTGAPPMGPPDPWGDGSLPDSTARGPAVDTTTARMTALRASVGFWRIDRNARTFCPTLADLARTPGAIFDRATMERDAWGTPFAIDCLGARVRIRSYGPDRAPDTADDLVTP